MEDVIKIILSSLNVVGLSVGLAFIAIRKIKTRKNGGVCSEHSGMVACLEALKSGQVQIKETVDMILKKLIPGR